mgnify:FL=1
MGEYFQDSEKVRMDFPDGNWVDIKEELSQADQDYIMSQMAKTLADNGSSNIEMNLGQLPLLERSVIAWSFAVPVNRENISRLRRRYRGPLLLKIDELNTKALEFVSKNA